MRTQAGHIKNCGSTRHEHDPIELEASLACGRHGARCRCTLVGRRPNLHVILATTSDRLGNVRHRNQDRLQCVAVTMSFLDAYRTFPASYVPEPGTQGQATTANDGEVAYPALGFRIRFDRRHLIIRIIWPEPLLGSCCAWQRQA